MRGIVGTTPVPIDWPEQRVTIVDEQTSRHVKSVKYRTFGDSAYFLRHAEELDLSGSTYPGTIILPRQVRRILRIEYRDYPGSRVIWISSVRRLPNPP